MFDGNCQQEDVFEGADINGMINNVLDGFHSTIFCYGQTGSGKTYTMDGYKYKRSDKGVFLPLTEDIPPENGGLVQRCVSQLLTQI